MARVLVVEDDQFFRSVLVDLLSPQHEVVEAADGKSAQNILSLKKVDLVITDVQMPGISGVDLLEWSQKHCPTPFIMMTGFSMLLETQSAFQMGARDFLTKPFKAEVLLNSVEKILGSQPEAEEKPDKTDDDFCRVSLEDFVSRSQVEFEVYVRMKSGHYIKIAHRGDGIPTERLQHYREKGLEFLYIPKEDFDKLVQFNLNLGALVTKSDTIQYEKKVNFLKYTGEVIMERAFINGVNKKSFDEAKVFMGMVTETLCKSRENLDLLTLLNEHADYLYAHSLAVAIYSVMVARQLDYHSSQTLFKLGMAGLYHDIGLKEIDRDLLDKPRALLSTKERSLIESHVVRGYEILSEIRSVPDDVRTMCYEHHEDCAGQGYPNRKNKSEMNTLSHILLTVTCFVDAALKRPSYDGLPATKAIEQIERIYGSRLDSSTLQALKQIFFAAGAKAYPRQVA